MGAVRGNIIVPITFCPLMCLGISIDHCVLTKLQRSDPSKLSIEEQPSSDAFLSSARVDVASQPSLDVKSPDKLAI